jgi:ribonuclease T2
MSKMATLALTVAVLLQGVAAGLYGESTSNHTCALVNPLLSCSAGAQANLTDSCCVETFGGLVV